MDISKFRDLEAKTSTKIASKFYPNGLLYQHLNNSPVKIYGIPLKGEEIIDSPKMGLVAEIKTRSFNIPRQTGFTPESIQTIGDSLTVDNVKYQIKSIEPNSLFSSYKVNLEKWTAKKMGI